jgi:hypothetical protein
MTRRLAILFAVTALAVSAGAASASASSTSPAQHLTINLENTMVSSCATTAKSNGLIIKDGNAPCDPIHHMGC